MNSWGNTVREQCVRLVAADGRPCWPRSRDGAHAKCSRMEVCYITQVTFSLSENGATMSGREKPHLLEAFIKSRISHLGQ